MKNCLWPAELALIALVLVLAGMPQTAMGEADTTPPTGTIVINNNRSATNTPNVTLSLTWDDGPEGSGVARMRFSDDGAHWSAWEAPAATRAYTLPSGGDGHRTVRVQYLDKANNYSPVYSDSIRLDSTPPTGAITINDGATATTSQTVTLNLTGSDGTGTGVWRMRFSDDGAHWTAWETPQTTHPHTLTPLNGYHTVRVQYRDGADNYSAVYSDYIKLQIPPPTEETVLLPGDVPLTMVWTPGGSYMMGRYAGEQDSWPDEDPQHEVTLDGFWMGKYSVTKRQWMAVMGTTPWTGHIYVSTELDSPAVCVMWNDTQSFLAALNRYTGKSFRLPSESQREYACRAGTTTRFYWGDDPDYMAVGDYAWYNLNARYGGQEYAHVVGQKLPNAFGLYDMSGNVWEWCQDWCYKDYTGAPADGSAWESLEASFRVLRGGDWNDPASHCRSADRSTQGSRNDDIGFRIVRNP